MRASPSSPASARFASAGPARIRGYSQSILAYLWQDWLGDGEWSLEARVGEREVGIQLRKPYYGWYIACLAFISLFIGAGTGGFTFGIFLPAMNEDLGWSRSTIVVGSSLTSITAALVGPLLGRISDQRGPRVVLVPSLLLMGFSLFCAGQVTEPWQFYLSFGIMSGAARSALQSVIPGAMIATWFQRRRSAAYGLAAMGPPVSNLLMPPIMTVL